jgi:ABC-2 type transport system permease protein
MSRWRSVWLVARREIIERGRSRGFLLSVLFTTLLVVGSFIVPTLLFGDEEATRIGIVQPEPPGLALAIETAGAQLDQEIEIVPLADAAAADAALLAEDDGGVDAVVDVPADLSTAGTIRFDDEPDQLISQLVSASVIALRTQAVVTEAGVSPGDLAAAQQPPTVEALDPQTDADAARFLFANIGAVLILVGIFSFGFTVLTGVVEEKQSRVVEVVLSTVPARDLLMGKVLGIGVLGLAQLAVFVAAAMGAAVATDRLVLPETTPTSILQLAIWFVLGYALYSTALGFLGALASRMEEASNASTPVTMIAMISYFVGIFAVINDPSGLVAQVATYLPPSAPFVVPLRAAFDAIGPIETLISMAITIVGIWVLFTIGARVYAGAVLQTGGRMKVRDAWRSAGG